MLRELRRRAPHADIVYFGDLKNAPYGDKSREELGALTVLGIQKLLDLGATEIVSACNSISVSIVLPLFEILKLPHANLIEMVGPTIASFRGTNAHVLVLATRATIESGIYEEGLRMVGCTADGVPIPDLVGLIEQGASRDTILPLVRSALAPLARDTYTHVILGCTHFPLVRDVFEEAVSERDDSVTLVDPAVPVVTAALERFHTAGTGAVSIHTSQASTVFSGYAEWARTTA